jgi:hypothetical protein
MLMLNGNLWIICERLCISHVGEILQSALAFSDEAVKLRILHAPITHVSLTVEGTEIMLGEYEVRILERAPVSLQIS